MAGGRVSGFLSGRRSEAALGGVTATGAVWAGVDGVANYFGDQSENPEHSKLYSAAESTVVAAGWLFAEPLMWGITVGQMAAGGAKMAYEDMKETKKLKENIELHARQDATGLTGGTLGGKFVDNEQAYTMRQRQMDVLRQHKISTESILGSEARQLHK